MVDPAQPGPAWLRLDAAPADTAPPRTDADVVIDGATARTRAELFAVLAAALDLPGHFGRNWDALADVLADRLDSGPLALVVDNAGRLLADESPEQLGILLAVVGGVAAGARQPIRLVLRDAPERLPALRHRVSVARRASDV